MKSFTGIALLLLVLFSCKNKDKQSDKTENETTDVTNIYKNEIYRTIKQLEYKKQTGELQSYLSHQDPKVRRAAVLAFAGIQDTTYLNPLSLMLKDEMEDVREAAAYTIGLMNVPGAEDILLTTMQTEPSLHVKAMLLESVGRCGSEKSLDFVASLQFENNQLLLITAQAWSLYRFLLRDIQSEAGLLKIMELLKPTSPEKTRYAASFYLSRLRDVDLTPHYQDILDAFSADDNIYTKCNLALCLRNTKNNDVLDLFKMILTSTYDFRIKVNAIRGMYGFDYEAVKEMIFPRLHDDNAHISRTAAEYLLNNGKESDAKRYFEKAVDINYWQSSAILYGAAIKHAENKSGFIKKAKKRYEQTNDKYEKALLLRAISYDFNQYQYIADEIFSTQYPVVKSKGMEALVALRQIEDFEKIDKKRKRTDVHAEFGEIMKKAIQSGDDAMIALAADVLATPKFKYNEYFRNTYFLIQALNKLELPKHAETYQYLLNAINFINGREGKMPELRHKPIDWNIISALNPYQQVKVETTKGEIILQLYVNEAPVTCGSFVEMIKDDYYDGKYFHRVVPGFVAQTGCPRGDGWGSLDFAIRTEIYPLRYTPGAVGMASAGKNTESVQWFITHSPTPHLEGNYSLFATVISGMGNALQLDVGDKILNVTLLNSSVVNRDTILP